MANKPIIIISGPTASGKTGISITLAREVSSKLEIVNFDSLLFYRDLNIGTAKPTEEEMKGVPHHLINVRDANKEINANDFVKLALEEITLLHAKNKVPVLVGGSTFYLRSLIKGMYNSPTTSPKIREEVEKIYRDQGIDPIIDFLNEHDPKSVDQLHQNDHYRLMRAYEHYKMTGTPISQEKEAADENDPYDFSKNVHPNWDIFHINLDLDKNDHWKIINHRAKQMIASGLITEVKDLLKKGYTGQEKPLQSIGYKETLSYLKGEIKDKDELQEKIYFATRRLAKSQKTFLKKVRPKNTYHPIDDMYKIIKETKSFLGESE
jgi:tRNA dimethylallyltransferase